MEDNPIFIIKDGKGEIPQGKRLVPCLDSLKSFTIPDRGNGGLEKAILENKPDSAEVCILSTGRTYSQNFPKANVTVRYTTYAALYCALEDDPEYAQKLKEAVQSHHGC